MWNLENLQKFKHIDRIKFPIQAENFYSEIQTFDQIYEISEIMHFLSPEERPFHKCGRSSIASFAGGLVTVVVLRKCCSVTDETAPCRISEEGIPDIK